MESPRWCAIIARRPRRLHAGRAGYFTEISSISKFSVLFGGIAAGAALAVGHRGGQVMLRLAARLHHLHRLGPAGDHPVEREFGGLAALVRAVEFAAIGKVPR
jgi:hypothetical protein